MTDLMVETALLWTLEVVNPKRTVKKSKEVIRISRYW